MPATFEYFETSERDYYSSSSTDETSLQVAKDARRWLA
jgi:hypothetical protein